MTLSRWCFAVVVVALLALPAAAADVVTVGTVTATATTVDVPISIRDAAGTPLGMDRPAGSKIQSFSIKVTYAPANAVASIAIERDGVTEALTPTSEFKPANGNSISILATFPEGSQTIPFSLNAAPPGDRVALLRVTLSSLATPGTTITLTLDPALTQLTDTGGSAATKETEANGQLALVDGSITIPNPTLTLTPGTLTVPRTQTNDLTARLSIALTNDTTVTVVSNNPDIASVPATIVIPAGSKNGAITVSGNAVGSTSVTASLSPSIGGATATANVNVSEFIPDCVTPAAPQIAPPIATLGSDSPYAIAWLPSANATEYLVDEATAANFTDATTKTVTAAPATFTHSVTSDTRFYYRVRARNHASGCDKTSAASSVVSVLVTAGSTPPPVTTLRVIPVVGSTPGSFGSFFKTSVQLFNPSDVAMSGRIVYHPSDGSADATLAYSLAPGKSLAYDDLLPAMARTGLGTADLVADTGSALPVSSVRVFNDAGADGTTGLNEEAFALADALQTGETGALIAPADFTRFRLNIGVRTLAQGATMTVTVRDRDGIVLKTLDRSFGPTHFEQTSSAGFLQGYALTGGESITIRINSGSAFLYGATTDNKTNDPSIQFVRAD